MIQLKTLKKRTATQINYYIISTNLNASHDYVVFKQTNIVLLISTLKSKNEAICKLNIGTLSL